MSEPAIFSIIRDGGKRFYGDRWASVFLYRELAFGPEAFETWVKTLYEFENYEDFEPTPAVVLDFDKRNLTWYHEHEELAIPKVAALLQKLLETSWKGFKIVDVASFEEVLQAMGVKQIDAPSEKLLLECRRKTVNDIEDDFDEHEYDDDEADDQDELNHKDAGSSQPVEAEEFYEGEQRAWVTVVDKNGAIRHRQLAELSQDLLTFQPQALVNLINLPSCEVPPEAVVREGMWIDQAEQMVGVWGGPRLRSLFPQMQRAWNGWEVQWAARGYSQHCSCIGPMGVQLSNEEALARIVPTILSTERFDLKTFVSAIGGSLKRTAIKATGCLTLIICSPLLIFGAVSGNWRAVLITVGIVVGLVVLGFLYVLRKFRRGVARTMDQGQEPTGPPTAGPLDKIQRRTLLDQLLAQAGLPPISKIEKHFAPGGPLGLPE